THRAPQPPAWHAISRHDRYTRWVEESDCSAEDVPRREGLHRPRFPWTPIWANEAGRSGVIGDESGEGWPGGGNGDGGGGAADGRGATRAVECAGEGRDRAPALEGRGAGHGVAGDAGAGARARALAADLPRGRDQR